MDLTVDKLRRVAIEALTIQGLPVGQFTFISKRELLKALGMNEDGTRSKVTTPFVSAKKTVNTRKATKMVGKTARPADDKRYQNFRKENYYETVKSIKEVALLNAAPVSVKPTAAVVAPE